jgi:hypothetical protein
VSSDSGSVKVRYTGAASGGSASDGVYAFSIFTRASGKASTVPEPSTILSILGLSLCFLAARRLRRG